MALNGLNVSVLKCHLRNSVTQLSYQATCI